MTKTLQQKIDDYKKTVSEHKKENREYFRELVRLVAVCEVKFGSFVNAPTNSYEAQSVKLQEKKMPKMYFKERALCNFSEKEKLILRKQIVCLHRNGYDSYVIGNILGLHVRSVKSVIRYRVEAC